MFTPLSPVKDKGHRAGGSLWAATQHRYGTSMLSSEAVSALEDADEYVYKSTLTHPSASPVFKYRSAS